MFWYVLNVFVCVLYVFRVAMIGLVENFHEILVYFLWLIESKKTEVTWK